MSTIDQAFTAYDVRGIYGKQVDEDLAWKVGHASAQFLRSLLSGYERGLASTNRVVIGHDMRPHTQGLLEALIEGVTSSGAGCIVLGPIDTPMLYFAINHLSACGGVQITASHGPIEQNGFKICGLRARHVGSHTGLKEVLHIARSLRRMPSRASMAPVQQMDLWDEYRSHVQRFLQLARRLKVVVDAGNGMAAKMIPAVFSGTELEIVPLNFELGGPFAHPPAPLAEANRLQAAEAVAACGADLGVCFDGDADRCVFLDETGRAVRPDLMTAMLGRRLLEREPGATIVYDLRCSRVVPEEIRAAGGMPRRERVGSAYINKAMTDAHGLFGGELSGAMYFRDNFNCASAAIALATLSSILSNQVRPLSELIAPLKRYFHTGQISFSPENLEPKVRRVADAFADAEIDRLDGLTGQYDNWWFNLRTSVTTGQLRLTLEASDEETVREKVKAMTAILGEPTGRLE